MMGWIISFSCNGSYCCRFIENTFDLLDFMLDLFKQECVKDVELARCFQIADESGKNDFEDFLV